MPYYFAHGKDIRAECSIKLLAESDVQAFALAKKQLPIVAALDRIEPDGTIVAVRSLPFDSLKQEVVPIHEARLEQGRKSTLRRRMTHATILALLLLILVRGCQFVFSSLSPQPNPSYPQVPTSQQPAPAPQK